MPSFSSTRELADTTKTPVLAGNSLDSSEFGSFSVLLPRSAVRAGPHIVGSVRGHSALSGPLTEGLWLHFENYIAMHEHLDLLTSLDAYSMR